MSNIASHTVGGSNGDGTVNVVVTKESTTIGDGSVCAFTLLVYSHSANKSSLTTRNRHLWMECYNDRVFTLITNGHANYILQGSLLTL